ncbi:17S U2 SnRNP complex component HTATSF1-like [Tubulanus polymorphus]|uniref:17S U2 SnRNP complex component HTATSF1-like n=1 Tax=Tubulanus polymorphus TaxID=672921 RepID=UPI003DA3D3ED
MTDANDDFKKQLEQEEFARQQDNESRSQTYTDKDGTVFEWDSVKKAYFPKIDEDFIANYQLNFGVSETEKAKNNGNTGGGNSSTAPQQQASSSGESSNQNSEYTWDDYCRYYQYYYGTLPPEASEYYGKYDMSEYYAPEAAANTANETSSEDCRENSQGSSQEEKVSSEQNKKNEKDDAAKAGDKRKRPEGWFKVDDEKNTNVYVSGLPSNTTEESFLELMSKYGMIMHDPFTRKPKIKLYKDENGEVKGDGRCCFIKNESVVLALQILDGSDIEGHTIHVERAQFQQKGEYDPTKKKKLSNKMKKKLRQQQQKLFDWRPDKPSGLRLKHERIVVVANAFDSKSFEKNPAAIIKVRDEVRTECAKYGEVRKVSVYDHHKDGVVSVIFKEPEMADACIQGINKRIFLGRVITAETWDGQTKYDTGETEADREARLKKWQTFLNESDNQVDAESTKTTPAAASDDEKPNETKEPENSIPQMADVVSGT